MIDIRAGILAITICLLINHFANNHVPPPQPQNAELCVQRWYNKWGEVTAREWVPCDQLNRGEWA